MTITLSFKATQHQLYRQEFDSNHKLLSRLISSLMSEPSGDHYELIVTTNTGQSQTFGLSANFNPRAFIKMANLTSK
jgi:hypothetical protein